MRIEKIILVFLGLLIIIVIANFYLGYPQSDKEEEFSQKIERLFAGIDRVDKKLDRVLIELDKIKKSQQEMSSQLEKIKIRCSQ